MLTCSQKLKNQSSSHPHENDPGHSKNNIHIDQGVSSSQTGKDKVSFDFIQFCEESKIQISPLDYLKSHPSELKRLIDQCRGNASKLNHSVTVEEGDETLMSNLFNQKDSIALATSPRQKPN